MATQTYTRTGFAGLTKGMHPRTGASLVGLIAARVRVENSTPTLAERWKA